jgi:hypothetical protein
MVIPIGMVLFLLLVLTTSVAQAQSPEQRVIKAYVDCTAAAFRARVDQVNDPNLLAETSFAACPTEEAAVLAWYQYRFSVGEVSPAYSGLYMSRLKLRLKQQMIEAAKTRQSPAIPSPPAIPWPPNPLPPK